MTKEKTATTAKKTSKTITVELIRGLIGQTERAKANVRGLGLRRVNSRRELEDTPAIRGMVERVSHLVKIVN